MTATDLYPIYTRFLEGLTTRIWEQWGMIGAGISSPVKRQMPNWIIDPEALILFSTRLFSFEPRLREVVLDWLITNGSQICVPRLKRIEKGYQLADQNALSELITILQTAAPGFQSWKSLHPPIPEEMKSIVQEVSPFKSRKLSVEPHPHELPNLVFKFRSLFGVQARVETLLYLLCHQRGYPAQIATYTAWGAGAIQQALADLSRSGHVNSLQTRDQKRTTFQLNPADWAAFLPIENNELKWLTQPVFYRAQVSILEGLRRGSETLSNKVRTLLVRENLQNGYMDWGDSGVPEIKEKTDTENASLLELASKIAERTEAGPESWAWHLFPASPFRRGT